MNKLKVGDTIECSNKEEMVSVSLALEKEGYSTDFLYEKDNKEGLWVEIIQPYPVPPTLEEVKQQMCDNYCKYPNEYNGEGELFEYICNNCPLAKYEE